MTGFGKATLQLATKKITVEVKSLNSKGLDLNVRMPSVYREMELGLRNQISQSLERGKVDFSLYIEVTGEETSTKINAPIVKAYMSQMEYQRPLTVAPGTPRERLEILRRAFKATLADPEFQAQAAKSKLDITYVSGEEAERIVGEVLAISPRVRENLQFLSQAK